MGALPVTLFFMVDPDYRTFTSESKDLAGGEMKDGISRNWQRTSGGELEDLAGDAIEVAISKDWRRRLRLFLWLIQDTGHSEVNLKTWQGVQWEKSFRGIGSGKHGGGVPAKARH
jgi:hypothetical protein